MAAKIYYFAGIIIILLYAVFSYMRAEEINKKRDDMNKPVAPPAMIAIGIMEMKKEKYVPYSSSSGGGYGSGGSSSSSGRSYSSSGGYSGGK